jgi:hypothetical protein
MGAEARLLQITEEVTYGERIDRSRFTSSRRTASFRDVKSTKSRGAGTSC